jgi:hypothetical protein
MSDFVELIVSFPAVVFTAMLVFSLAWWLVSFLAGGLDVDGVDADGLDGGGVDVDGLDGGGDADAGNGEGDLGGRVAATLGAPGLPLSISFTIISFGAWVASIALTAVARAAGLSGPLLVAVGAGAVAVSVIAGVRFARVVARPLAPVFTTLGAPSVGDAIGSLARVRSIVVDDGAPGEVLVTTGPARSTVLRARAEQTFHAGAIVHVIDRDDDGVYVVTAVDPTITDGPGTPGT